MWRSKSTKIKCRNIYKVSWIKYSMHTNISCIHFKTRHIYVYYRFYYILTDIRYGYTTKSIKISEVIEERDRELLSKIVSNPEHALHELLHVCKHRILRQREHNFILSQIKTERFKRSFINRCIFNYF